MVGVGRQEKDKGEEKAKYQKMRRNAQRKGSESSPFKHVKSIFS